MRLPVAQSRARLLRLLAVAGLGACSLEACTSLLGDFQDGASADAGALDGTTVGDGSADVGARPDAEGGPDADAAPPVHAKITFVHAAPGVFPVRLCVALGTPPTFTAGLYPLPNNLAQEGVLPYPPFLALPSGSGATLPDLGDLQDADVTLFAINAARIAADTSTMGASEPDCATLLGPHGQGVGGGGLVPNSDYVQLPQIPSGTFGHGGSFLAVLEGCLGGDTASSAPTVCGATYDGAHESQPLGNVGLQAYRLDNSAPAANVLGLQVLQASSASDGYYSTVVGAQAVANTIGLTDEAVDGGGGNAPVVSLIDYGAALMPNASAPQNVKSVDFYSLDAYLVLSAPDGGALYLGGVPGNPNYGVITIDFSFAGIQQFSGFGYPTEDGGSPRPVYAPGANYALLWVGDPRQPRYIDPADGGASTADTAVLNPGSAHFMMFPSDPVVPPL